MKRHLNSTGRLYGMIFRLYEETELRERHLRRKTPLFLPFRDNTVAAPGWNYQLHGYAGYVTSDRLTARSEVMERQLEWLKSIGYLHRSRGVHHADSA